MRPATLVLGGAAIALTLPAQRRRLRRSYRRLCDAGHVLVHGPHRTSIVDCFLYGAGGTRPLVKVTRDETRIEGAFITSLH